MKLKNNLDAILNGLETKHMYLLTIYGRSFYSYVREKTTCWKISLEPVIKVQKKKKKKIFFS